MNTSVLSVFSVLSLLIFADVTSAQSRVAKTLLNGWDRNKNGLLEKSEIPEVAREKVYAMAKQKGLDTSKALPVKNLLARAGKLSTEQNLAVKKKMSAKLDKKAQKTLGSSDAKVQKQRKSKDAKTDVERSAESKRSGSSFGSQLPAKVETTGFGNSKQEPAAKAETQDKEVKDAKDNGKDDQARRRLKFLAKSMMAQHDSNRSGKLEKNEWSRIRGNPGASDANRDGVLTSEELEQHLGEFATQEKDRRSLSKPKSSTRSKNPSSRKTYRFLTAHERLPKGLPSWFTDRDQNLDGQLSLREYSSRLSQAKLDQFRGLDLNNDGFIVPKEYLTTLE